eukprot:129920-Pleurochrysis_carterae.AAC.1
MRRTAALRIRRGTRRRAPPVAVAALPTSGARRARRPPARRPPLRRPPRACAVPLAAWTPPC